MTVKDFFANKTVYMVAVGLLTAANVIMVGYRSDNRVDFNTLLTAYEQENARLRSQNTALLLRINELEFRVAEMNSEIIILRSSLESRD